MNSVANSVFAKIRRHLALTFGGFVVIALIVLGSVFHGQVRAQLNDWKLLPRPEKLTELYFTHPNNLPQKYTPGDVQEVNFTVHNLEYKTVNYQFVIVEQTNGGNQSAVLSSGNFKLKQNQYKKLTQYVNTPDLGKNIKLTVKLTNVNESIDELQTRSQS